MTARPRTHNPFLRSTRGARLLSALQLPFFLLRPPVGYGVLTTVGRTTGCSRRRCVRAPRQGDRVYLVAIKGSRTGWVQNVLAHPEVRIRVRSGTFRARARPVEPTERDEAMAAYTSERSPFEHVEHGMWRKGRSTRARVDELHRQWFSEGFPLVLELDPPD